MADILDIETALANLCGTVIYPNGTSQPSAAGVDCKIFAGWPNSAELANSLSLGMAEISIYSGQNLESVTTRYSRDWYDVSKTVPTITATVTGNSVTIGGAVSVDHYVTVVVDGVAYSYACALGDTLAGVASALAAQMLALGATSTGAVLSLPARFGGLISAKSSAPGIVGRELGRQKRGMMISIWAPSPQTRSAIASLLMGMVHKNTFVQMQDGSRLWMSYRQSNESDGAENAMAYRRDIQVWAEYATTETMTAYPVSAFAVSETLVPDMSSATNQNTANNIPGTVSVPAIAPQSGATLDIDGGII